MSCVAIGFLTFIVLFSAILVSLGLLSIGVALIIIAIAAALAFLLYAWRVIYPWLVRMGRWAAQLRNTIFLIVVLVGIYVVWYALNLAGITIPPTVLLAILIPLGLLFILLLVLAIVVWLVRLWRYSWPPSRNLFWDLGFRIVALFWRILVGIPLGIVWFFYHPPLRWLVATLLFYLRGISAGVAKALYNPPLRSIAIALLWVNRLIGRIVAWLLYNPPIRWVIEFGLFILGLLARFISTIIYGLWSWWPIKGARWTLSKGVVTESDSYRHYEYYKNDVSGAIY